MRAPEFWREDGLLPHILSPLSAGYGLAGRLRDALAHPKDPGAPVICIGNLVAGGAGKTPVAISLLKLLTAHGKRAYGLTRGYGGRLAGPERVDPARHDADHVGDEALLLARAAPTWIARNRVAGALAATSAGADVIVMDDGLQNPHLTRRLSLLVVDGTYGFGNARVMPAGPLREPLARGLARADAAVILGKDTWGVEDRLRGRLNMLRAELAPDKGTPALAGRRVVAFAGIGRPGKFFATLEAMGAILIECRAFADHYRYRHDDLAALIAHAGSEGAIVVTTEKDEVRVPAELRGKVMAVPVAVAWQNLPELESLLARALGSGLPGQNERSGAA